MTWDDTKQNDTDGTLDADEQLTATEWNNHVSDQKGHAGRHESGGSDELADLGDISPDSIDNQLYASQFAGSGLAAKIRDALDWSENNVGGQATVVVTAKDDGTAWALGGELVLDAATYPSGFDVRIGANVDIEYSGSGQAIQITGEYSDADINRLVGGSWTATGTPTDFCVIEDTTECYVAPDVATGWSNGSPGDCTIFLLRNDSRFSESVVAEVRQRATGDRGIDFEGASVTGGTGTDSFQRCHFPRLNGAFGDFGVRTRNGMSNVLFERLSLNASADGFDGVVLNHDNQNPIFQYIEIEDNAGVANATGFTTGTDYDPGFPPVIAQDSMVALDTDYDIPDGQSFGRQEVRSKRIGWYGTEGDQVYLQADARELVVDTAGSNSSPSLQIGTNGAGFYISGGEIIAVDEAGNETPLT